MANKIDIIIPVYNNVELTICCIKSVYQHLRDSVNNVIIHDDCSSQETNLKLNKIKNSSYYNLKIIRSEPNIGFAAGVNKACDSLATAPYLFILNSDTEIQADIITPMLKILEHHPEIAAINPSGPVYSAKKLKRCASIRDAKLGLSYIPSTNASGYALLIRREVFTALGGFNTVYGRGYYEDNELSRVLINNNYQLAIYETNDISHVGQSSFNSLNQKNKTKNFAKDLIKKNRELYLQRNPKAMEALDIYTLKSDFQKLPEQIQSRIIETTQNGGIVTINGLFQPKNLPFYQIKFKKLSFGKLIKLVYKLKIRKKSSRKILA